MDAKIEDCICKNITWPDLPIEIKKVKLVYLIYFEKSKSN